MDDPRTAYNAARAAAIALAIAAVFAVRGLAQPRQLAPVPRPPGHLVESIYAVAYGFVG